MEWVKIGSVRPGQVLAQAAIGRSGAELCPAGFRMTETVIERLRMAGVESLAVEGGGRKFPSPPERLAALERRFQGIDDPILLQIKAIIESRLRLMDLARDA